MGLKPGNAILLNGFMQTANQEIGVPGFAARQIPNVIASAAGIWLLRG
jgi:hypothetical protein